MYSSFFRTIFQFKHASRANSRTDSTSYAWCADYILTFLGVRTYVYTLFAIGGAISTRNTLSSICSNSKPGFEALNESHVSGQRASKSAPYPVTQNRVEAHPNYTWKRWLTILLNQWTITTTLCCVSPTVCRSENQHNSNTVNEQHQHRQHYQHRRTNACMHACTLCCWLGVGGHTSLKLQPYPELWNSWIYLLILPQNFQYFFFSTLTSSGEWSWKSWTPLNRTRRVTTGSVRLIISPNRLPVTLSRTWNSVLDHTQKRMLLSGLGPIFFE